MNEIKVNDNLLSDLILAYLKDDDLATSIINTRLVNRYNDDLLDLNDLVLVYKYFIQ